MHRPARSHSRRTRRLPVLTAACATLALPATAQAHGIAQRSDLPIPQWLFAWAAGLVLIASFTALSLLWPRPLLRRLAAGGRRSLPVPRAWDVLGGTLGIALFVLVVYAGLAGNQAATANLTPTFVYVALWVGVPVLSLLLGDVFAWLSPWRALSRAAGWAATRVGRQTLPTPLVYPARWGRWPAAIGIVGFAWLELVSVHRDEPDLLAVLGLAYAATMLLGISLFGVTAWTRNADPLGVYFGLFARLAPLRWTRGRVRLRPPLSGAATLPPAPGTLALLCAGIGTTSFDGFTQGALWSGDPGLSSRLATVFDGLGFGPQGATQAAATVGLLGAVAVIAGVITLGSRRAAAISGAREPVSHGGGALIPIAAAYLIAHYFSLLAFQAQALGYLASDPLGVGDDLLGTASASIDYGVVSANGIWYVQVAALVAGHVAGLMLAHDRALEDCPDPRRAVRSQYAILLLMVTLTSLGLWLLSATAQ